MNTMFRNNTLMITLLALTVGATESPAEQFIARFTYREFLNDKAGAIVTELDNTESEVIEAGTDAGIDPKKLVLIYDTVADAVQVVKKSNGSEVATVFAFKDGTTVTSKDGKTQVRQAFLNIPDHGKKPHGSITGRVIRSFDKSGGIETYVWTASFQASIPEDVEVLEGTLTTHEKFVPRND